MTIKRSVIRMNKRVTVSPMSAPANTKEAHLTILGVELLFVGMHTSLGIEVRVGSSISM